MTILPEFIYPAFNAIAAELRSQGYHVENPAPDCNSWLGYMRLGVAQLVTCDEIYMLPGWQESRGARIEHGLVKDLGLNILEARE